MSLLLHKPSVAAAARSARCNADRSRGVVTSRGVAFSGGKGGKAPPPPSDDDEDIGTLNKAVIALGLPLNLVALWSEVTLVQTGAGLPPGPGGALGAVEGISYLVVPAIVGYSLYTKVQTGSGLPAGPSGLLGATEGVSFLTVLGAIAAFGYQVAVRGSVPGITG